MYVKDSIIYYTVPWPYGALQKTECNTKCLYHTFFYNYLSIEGIIFMRHPGDGHRSDRNMLVNNNNNNNNNNKYNNSNKWMNIFINVHLLICGNKMPTRCNRGFYCRSYCLLNTFRASLCPSLGAQEYYTVVAAYYFHILTTMHGKNHIKF